MENKNARAFKFRASARSRDTVSRVQSFWAMKGASFPRLVALCKLSLIFSRKPGFKSHQKLLQAQQTFQNYVKIIDMKIDLHR